MHKSSNLKTRAVDILIDLTSAESQRLGVFITRHRSILKEQLVYHIQQVGIHEYARLLLKRNSEYRAELIDIVKEDV